MPEIQTSGPGQKLARRYGLKGIVFAPSIEPVIVPVVLMDDLTEEAPTKRWGIVGSSISAAGGELAQTALALPAGSNKLISDVVLRFGVAAAALFSVTEGGPALSSSATPVWQDQRSPGQPEAVITMGVDVGAVTGDILRANAPASTLVEIDFGRVVFGTGGRLHLIIATAAVNLRFGWSWSEQALTAEEAF